MCYDEANSSRQEVYKRRPKQDPKKQNEKQHGENCIIDGLEAKLPSWRGF